MPIPRVSDSLGRLRAPEEAFGTGAAPADDPGVRELCRTLGRTAVPLLSRKLRSEDRGDAELAYRLLADLGGERVAAEARTLACDATVAHEARSLALGLLAELGVPPPPDADVEDVEALRDASVRDLLGVLVEAPDVARAADLIVGEVPAADLGAFVRDLAEAGGDEVAPIIDELLRRDDVEPVGAETLREVRAGLGEVPEPPPAAGKRRVYQAEREDGARALLVVQRIAGASEAQGAPRRPARLRALSVVLEPGGRIASLRYEPELPPRAGLRRMQHALVAAGFVPRPARSARAAARLLAEAVRLAHAAGERLPRGYWLGRDLLAVAGEPEAALPRTSRRVARRAVLERAALLLEQGDPGRAEPLLRRFVAAVPDDADARALLAHALLDGADGDRHALEAIRHLEVACRLEPGEALHPWNLAHAAKRAGRLGASYLALCRYLEAQDDEDGREARVECATSYVRLFERYARLEHPETSALRVARAEELFERAYDHLTAGRLDEAVSGFEAVLKLVPSHYPSWANLGVAYAAHSNRDEAERCLRRALSYRPDYAVALRNLSALVE